MELNREQAIDILDRFDFFQGQRAGRELWNDKPFDVQEQDIAKFSHDVALLKNYIKKLTEENEAWQKQLISQKEISDKAYYELACEVENLRVENEKLRSEVSVKKKLLDKCVDLEDKVKADTVRKMQERLKAEFADDSIHGQSEIYCVIDHITNEVL